MYLQKSRYLSQLLSSSNTNPMFEIPLCPNFIKLYWNFNLILNEMYKLGINMTSYKGKIIFIKVILKFYIFKRTCYLLVTPRGLRVQSSTRKKNDEKCFDVRTSKVQLFFKLVNKTLALLCNRKWLYFLGKTCNNQISISTRRNLCEKYFFCRNEWQINASILL